MPTKTKQPTKPTKSKQPAKAKQPAKSAKSAKPTKQVQAKAPPKEKAKRPAAAPKTPAKAKASVKAKAPVKPNTTETKAIVDGFRNFVPYQAKKGEEYMNDRQKEHFKSILLNWKSQLMEEVDRTVSHMKDEAANFPDPADRVTQEEEFSLELRTRDRERKLIKKIDSTIELIDQNDYGYCDACGVEIGIKRLEARPTATLCIDCKTLDEIRERQQHG